MLVGDMQEERPEIEDGGRPSGKARLAEEEEADCDGERDRVVGIAVGRGKQRRDAGQKGAPAIIDSEVDGRAGPPDPDRNRGTDGKTYRLQKIGDGNAEIQPAAENEDGHGVRTAERRVGKECVSTVRTRR